MTRPSNLEIKHDGPCYEYVINGVSLRERLERHEGHKTDGMCVLGMAPGAVERLLLEAPPDLPDNRTSLYICPLCADLGCGAVCTVITRIGDLVRWESLGWHNDLELEPPVLFTKVTGFTFEWAQYREALTSGRLNAPWD